MILNKIIYECTHAHKIYYDDTPCKHCRISKKTCEHACRILKVTKPVDYKEEKK